MFWVDGEVATFALLDQFLDKVKKGPVDGSYPVLYSTVDRVDPGTGKYVHDSTIFDILQFSMSQSRVQKYP